MISATLLIYGPTDNYLNNISKFTWSYDAADSAESLFTHEILLFFHAWIKLSLSISFATMKSGISYGTRPVFIF